MIQLVGATPVGQGLRYAAHTAGANSTAYAIDSNTPRGASAPSTIVVAIAAAHVVVATAALRPGAPARRTEIANRTLIAAASAASGAADHRRPSTV
jgi:hypothetical protein